MKKLIAALMLFGGVFWLCANYDDPNSGAPIIMGCLMIGVAIFKFVRLISRGRARRQAASQTWMVAQAISRPLPAPSVAEAFARLPDYCRSPARKDHA